MISFLDFEWKAEYPKNMQTPHREAESNPPIVKYFRNKRLYKWLSNLKKNIYACTDIKCMTRKRFVHSDRHIMCFVIVHQRLLVLECPRFLSYFTSLRSVDMLSVR